MAKIKVWQVHPVPSIHYGYAGKGQVYAETVLGPLVVRADADTLPEALEALGKAISGSLVFLEGLETPEDPQPTTREKVLEVLRGLPAQLGLPQAILYPPGGVTPEELADTLLVSEALGREKAHG